MEPCSSAAQHTFTVLQTNVGLQTKSYCIASRGDPPESIAMISAVLRGLAPCILIVAVSDARHALAAAPENAPIRIRAGLFDTTQPQTLGLQTLPGQHKIVYQAGPQTYKFATMPTSRSGRTSCF